MTRALVFQDLKAPLPRGALEITLLRDGGVLGEGCVATFDVQ